MRSTRLLMSYFNKNIGIVLSVVVCDYPLAIRIVSVLPEFDRIVCALDPSKPRINEPDMEFNFRRFLKLF